MRYSVRRATFSTLGIMVLAASIMLVTAGTASAAPASPAKATTTASPHWTLRWPTVKFGDKGNRVFAIQYLLRARGYAVRPSGVFGGITRHDVAHFQRVRGLRGTGVVGASTWNRLIITVRFGSRGNAVAGVQQNLHFGHGYKFLPVTGFFGHITLRAVRSFQRKMHITVDGIVGPVTWNRIIRFET